MRPIADHAFDGLAVTDSRGHVVYSNAAYLALTGAATPQDARPVERVFIGNPDVSEAVFRLLKAAREGKRQQEEVRIAGTDGAHGRWLRMRVRPLGQSKRQAKYAVWSIADITRDRERQEDVFQELQHAIEYLDHAPCGFFSVNAAGDLVYVNATLANWLDHDLAEIGNGGLKLTDIVSGDGASLLTSIVPVPGEVKTEVFDIDLRMRGGKTMPVRLYHKLAFGADGAPGASRTLVISRARDERLDPQRAAEVRFMRFFDHTPMAIATVDKSGAVVRANARFAKLAQSLNSGGAANKSILVGGQRPRPQPSDRGDQSGRGRAGRHRAGRGDARWRQGALGPVFRHRGRGRRARDRGRHRLHAGDHRAAHAGEPDQPVAEDGHGRPARRRHRARLQQRAVRDHDGQRLPAQRAQADRSVVPGHHADQAERHPRGDAGAAVAGVLAAADLAAAGARSRRRIERSHHAAAPPDRREGQARPRARPRSVAGEGRRLAVRAGDRQSRGQCPRRHAGWRQADGAHRECAGAGSREAFLQGHAGGGLCADRRYRYRHRDPRRYRRQDFRAVLLDQGGRQGHRARAVDGVRHRQADRRFCLCRFRSRPRHLVPHLPAAASRRAGTAGGCRQRRGQGSRRSPSARPT